MTERCCRTCRNWHDRRDPACPNCGNPPPAHNQGLVAGVWNRSLFEQANRADQERQHARQAGLGWAVAGTG